MVSRLYPSTRSLWEQIKGIMRELEIDRGRPRRMVDLMALYVAGLILLEKGQTAVRIATILPARAHDALNRLLRVLPWSPQRLILGLIRWVQCRGERGYLILDDVVVEKPFAKLLAWAGWTYSHSQKRPVFGFHIVVCFWCTSQLRIPIGFRLWRPKREGLAAYQTKLELGQTLIANVLRAGLSFEYLTFDSWYNARWFTKWLNEHRILWVSTLKAMPGSRTTTAPSRSKSGRTGFPATVSRATPGPGLAPCLSPNTDRSGSSWPQTAKAGLTTS